MVTVCLLGMPLGATAADPPAATRPAAITWDQAGKHVGETLTITGPVMGTHLTNTKTSLILNVGKDYPDPARFTVLITLEDKNPATPEMYDGKKISVTGKIEMYKNAAEVRVAARDITVEK